MCEVSKNILNYLLARKLCLTGLSYSPKKKTYRIFGADVVEAAHYFEILVAHIAVHAKAARHWPTSPPYHQSF